MTTQKVTTIADLTAHARALSEGLNVILGNPVTRSALGKERVEALRSAAFHAGFAFGSMLTAEGK